MKKLLSAVLLIIMTLLSVSCNASEPTIKISSKEITADGFKITVASDFVENDTAAKKYGYTAILSSKAVEIMAVKEDKSLFNNTDIQSLSQYAEIVRNSTLSHDPGRIKEEEGLKYTFEYVALNPDNNREYTYLTVLYESKTAYWCFQFVCITSKYEDIKPTMLKYAKTVTFVD